MLTVYFCFRHCVLFIYFLNEGYCHYLRQCFSTFLSIKKKLTIVRLSLIVSCREIEVHRSWEALTTPFFRWASVWGGKTFFSRFSLQILLKSEEKLHIWPPFPSQVSQYVRSCQNQNDLQDRFWMMCVIVKTNELFYLEIYTNNYNKN